MLTIEFVPSEETITLADLFDQIDRSVFAPDDDGDLITRETFGIEVRSQDGYYPVEGFRLTQPLPVWLLETATERLLCAHEHLVYLPRAGGWRHVRHCAPGDYVMTQHGPERLITSRPSISDPIQMYDMQVADVHSFYTNGILSHNSHLLVQLGTAAMLAGKNVLHYTMELSESVVGIRYDSRFCNIPSNDVYDRRDDVLGYYSQTPLGRLLIKEYPTKYATINTIRSHIEKSILYGIQPGLIIIDYADVMRSTRHYDSMRHELQSVYEEVRNLAGELKLPVWTASQAHRDSSNSEIVGLENMAEAYGKAMVADVVLTLSRRPMEKATSACRLFVAKNRAGRDGLAFPCRIDTSMSKIEVLEDADEATLEQAQAEDNASLKATLRQKWIELNRTSGE